MERNTKSGETKAGVSGVSGDSDERYDRFIDMKYDIARGQDETVRRVDIENSDSIEAEYKKIENDPQATDVFELEYDIWKRTFEGSPDQTFEELPDKSIEKIKVLGRGSFSIVYLVKHPKHPTESLVLKQIEKHPDFKTNQLNKKRILREVKILKDLKAKCRIYSTCLIDFNVDDLFYYIFTNFEAEFEDMKKFLSDQKTPISFRENQLIMINLLTALKYIHQTGIVHRDLKPANILINPETKEVRIIDFGLACYFYQHDISSDNRDCLENPQGSPLYMAPETLLYKSLAMTTNFIAVDIWSLGIIFYQLLEVGQKNLETSKINTSKQTLPVDYWNLRKPEDFISFLKNKDKYSNPELDLSRIDGQTLSPIVVSMLAWDPNKRPSIDTLLEELKAL